MNLEELDAIIFDFGGVLINIRYEDTIQAFKDLGIEDFEERFSQAQQTTLFSDYETGKVSSEHFVNQLLRILPHGITPNDVVHAWNSMIKDVPEEVIPLLENLSKNKRIYLLSNTNDLHIDLALRNWHKVTDRSIHDIFDHVYLSQEVNLRKPQPEIFKLVCQEQGLVPERTLFVDDSIQHIESALSAGLKTHHLTKQSDIYHLFS